MYRHCALLIVSIAVAAFARGQAAPDDQLQLGDTVWVETLTDTRYDVLVGTVTELREQTAVVKYEDRDHRVRGALPADAWREFDRYKLLRQPPGEVILPVPGRVVPERMRP